MEGIVILVVLGLLGLLLLPLILAIVATGRVNRLQREVEQLTIRLRFLEDRRPEPAARAQEPLGKPTILPAASKPESPPRASSPPAWTTVPTVADVSDTAEPTAEADAAAVAAIPDVAAVLAAERRKPVVFTSASPLDSPIPAAKPTPLTLPTANVSESPSLTPALSPRPFSATRSPAPAVVTAEPRQDTPQRSQAQAGFDLERLIGQRGLTIAGVAVLVLGAAFFLKYAYDQDWLGRVIGPRMRIALIAAAALGMAVAGLRLLARMSALGQGLVAGGLALAYLAVYGALKPALGITPVALISPGIGFVLLASITAAGVAVAVRKDLLALAIGSLIGGLAAPALASTGGGDRDILFTYLLLLDLGVLAAAWWRRWRSLDCLAFAGTALYFAVWYHQHQLPESGNDATSMLIWLGIYHLVFLVIPFAHHWRLGTAVAFERFGLALGNLAFALGYAGALFGRGTALGLTCAGGAALYLALGLITARRCPDDGTARHGFQTLAILLLTLGLLFLLPVDTVAVAWAAESVALLWLGWRFASLPVRICAAGVLGVTILRVLILHVPLAVPTDPLVFNTWFPTLLAIPAATAAAAWIHRWHGATGAEATWSRILAHGAGLMLLTAATAELCRHAEGHAQAWAGLPLGSVIALLWAIGAGAYVVVGQRGQRAGTTLFALVPALIAGISAFAAYGDAWAFSLPVANLRFAAIAAVVAVWLWIGRATNGTWSVLAEVIALIGSALAVSSETGAWLSSTNETAARAGASWSQYWMWWTALGWILLAALAGLSPLRHRPGWRSTGLVLLLLAAPLTFGGYACDWHPNLPILNQRFLPPALLVLVLALLARSASDSGPRRTLAWIAILGGFCFLTVEPPAWALDHFSDRVVAGRIATFSVTAIWVTLAVVGLTLGFRYRIRLARWLALGLFGLIAIKLLLLDMQGAQQIWRILAFILTGVVLIAASFVYHRLEQRLGSQPGPTAPGRDEVPPV